MKKYIVAMLVLLTAGFASGQTYQLDAPVEITAEVTGFQVLNIQSLPNGSWEIMANVLSTLPLSDTGDKYTQAVAIKPIRVTVKITQAEVAASIGIDAESEGWEALYFARSIMELQTAVITVAQSKIIATVE